MKFVKNHNQYGVEAKEIPCLIGQGEPTVETEGAVGCLYMDEGTGAMYKCTSAIDDFYTWKNVGEGGGSGVYIGDEAPTNENVTVWIDTDEEPSADSEGNGVPFYVNILTENGYACQTDIATLGPLVDSSRLVIAKIVTDKGALLAPMCSHETSDSNSYGRIVRFALGAIAFTLTPNNGGGYDVTVLGD